MQLWTKGEMKRGVTQSQMCAEWGVGRAERDYWEEKRRQEGCRDGDEGSLGPLWKKGRGERLRTFQRSLTCSNQVYLMPFRFTVCFTLTEMPLFRSCHRQRLVWLMMWSGETGSWKHGLPHRCAVQHLHIFLWHTCTLTLQRRTERATLYASLPSFSLIHSLFFTNLFVRAWVESVHLE